MTAIEVLASTMLASLMLASIAGLLGGLAREGRILRAKSETPRWHQQLVEELTQDLQNSRLYSASRNGLRLEGFAARDFATGKPTGRPVVIEYFLWDAARDRWLLRRETHSDESTDDSGRLEVLGRGISRVQLNSITIDGVAGTMTNATVAKATDLQKLPDRIDLRIYASSSAAPIVDELLHVR